MLGVIMVGFTSGGYVVKAILILFMARKVKTILHVKRTSAWNHAENMVCSMSGDQGNSRQATYCPYIQKLLEDAENDLKQDAIADINCNQRQDEIWIFLPALYWNRQSCFSVSNVHIHNKRMLCETRVLIASAQAYAVRTGLR